MLLTNIIGPTGPSGPAGSANWKCYLYNLGDVSSGGGTNHTFVIDDNGSDYECFAVAASNRTTNQNEDNTVTCQARKIDNTHVYVHCQEWSGQTQNITLKLFVLFNNSL